MKKISNIAWLAGICFLLTTASAFALDAVGTVMLAVPQSTADRDGKNLPLSPEEAVHMSDILKTDEKGQLEVKFRDGTILALGPRSEAAVREFAASETQNVFHTDLFKGAARIVTGDIVKRNPGGFKITTPRSTIGIRGTTVLFVYRGGDEIISVESLGNENLEGAHVTVIDRDGASLKKIGEAGMVFVRRRGEVGAVSRLDEQKRLAVDALAGFTRVDSQTNLDEGVFNQLVDAVLQNVVEPSVSEPVAEPSAPVQRRRPPSTGLVDGDQEQRRDITRPGEKEGGPGAGEKIAPPPPREPSGGEKCD